MVFFGIFGVLFGGAGVWSILYCFYVRDRSLLFQKRQISGTATIESINSVDSITYNDRHPSRITVKLDDDTQKSYTSHIIRYNAAEIRSPGDTLQIKKNMLNTRDVWIDIPYFTPPKM